MNDAEILKSFRNKVGLSQPAFAEALSVSKGLIASIEIGSRTLSHKLNQKIVDVFGENILHPEVKECLPNNIIALPFYPVGASAGNGTLLLEEIEQEPMYFDRRFIEKVLKLNPDNIHIIYAQGDSMDSGWNQPDDIKDGDLLFIDPTIKSGNNQVFVIQQDDKLRVKMLTKQGDTLIVKSKNPKYPDELYTPDKVDTEISVIGKVVWNGSKE